MTKALSVRQPWASLIAEGIKTVEIRSRPWAYRGPLVICATAKPDPDMYAYDDAGNTIDLPCGVAICLVDLIDCHPLEPADALAVGLPWPLTYLDCAKRWAWVLANARPVRPVAIKGQLSPWEWRGPELVIVA